MIFIGRWRDPDHRVQSIGIGIHKATAMQGRRNRIEDILGLCITNFVWYELLTTPIGLLRHFPGRLNRDPISNSSVMRRRGLMLKWRILRVARLRLYGSGL